MEEDYKWDLELWYGRGNLSPVRKFLERLHLKNTVLHADVLRKIKTLRKSPIDTLLKVGYMEKIKNGLYELKIRVPKNEIRFFGVIRKGEFHVYEAIHAYHKKDQKIKTREMDVVLIRLKKYYIK